MMLTRVVLFPVTDIYRKSVEELQKNSDKKVALLTNATKKAETIVCMIFIILSVGKKW